MILGANEGMLSRMPAIDTVVSFPVLRSDGQLTREGFDRDARVYCASNALVGIPPAPTREDGQAACRRLTDLVSEFPFATPADRSVWIAFLLTFIVRPRVDCVPMFLVDGTSPGVGKGLLVRVAHHILTGQPPAVDELTAKDEETEKRIAALLLAGAPLINFDDVHVKIGGGPLQRYLTSETWRGRLLGASKMLTLPAKAIVVATGNNVQWRKLDMLRRVLPIRLLAPEGDPARRRFRVDILNYVREHRDELLRGLLTMVLAYSASSKPKDDSLPIFGSFEMWSSEVRQLLVWLGEPDPYLARKRLTQEYDGYIEALGQLLQVLREADPNGGGMTVQQIIRSAKFPEIQRSFEAVTDRVLDAATSSNWIGRELARLVDRPVGGLMLASTRRSQGTRYRVRPVGPEDGKGFESSSEKGQGDGTGSDGG